MGRIVKTRGGCGRQPWRRPKRPARDGPFVPAELLTMANSRPLNPPSVPTRESQHKAEGETHRRREASRSGLQIAGHVENEATCSGTVRGGWGQAGCRTGQPHPPQEQDKDEFDVAVCENGGELFEEVMILESYEEACAVGEGCKNDGMGGGHFMMFGRLRGHAEFWEEMGASKFIMSVVREGYRLPFVTEPPTGWLRNQKSCDQHEAFVDQTVNDLLRCGSAVSVDKEFPKCVSPLGVVQGASKLRLILVLSSRQVNECLAKFTFKLEDVRTEAKLYKKGDFVVTFDLKSGYHHIDMAEEHWRYLCFEWKGKFYCFRSLPFGLSTAPHLFNKMVRVMVRYWRKGVLWTAGGEKKGGRKRAVSPQCEVRLKMATADFAIMRLTAQPHCKICIFSNVAPKILENTENAQRKKKSDPKSPGLP